MFGPVVALALCGAVASIDAEFVASAALLPGGRAAAHARKPGLLLFLFLFPGWRGVAFALLLRKDRREEAVVDVVCDERDSSPLRPRVLVLANTRGDAVEHRISGTDVERREHVGHDIHVAPESPHHGRVNDGRHVQHGLW